MAINFKFKKNDDNHYQHQIYDGKNLISKSSLLKNKDQWLKIAEINPLNGISFIQALAMAGDVEATFLQCIYQTYRKFLENGETHQFERLSELVLKRPQKPSLKFYLATYIKALLEEEAVTDQQVIKAKDILHKLIPGFEKTLLTNIYRVQKEQKISVPEMQKSHRAFPDLFKHKGVYYIAFREADSHVKHGDLGIIRILKGSYNEKLKIWKFENAGVISDSKYDLRDPHFFVNANNQFMLVMGGSKINKKNMTTKMVPHVAFLKNNAWKIKKAIVEPNALLKKGQWIWRVTWNAQNNKGYALSYGDFNGLMLLETNDGVHFKKITDLSSDLLDEPYNEATIRFQEDGKMVALIRTEKHGLIATSTLQKSYKDWKYSLLNFRLGGPNFLIKPNGEMVAGTRYFFLEKDNTLDLGTVIAYMDAETLIPLMRVKSEYDNSYPGMCLEDNGDLSFLYYSGNEGGASDLYITRIHL